MASTSSGVIDIDEAIHQLPPGPETVLPVSPRISVRPAMPRWNAWLCRLGIAGTRIPRGARRRRSASRRLHAAKRSATLDRQPYILLPAFRQKSQFRMKRGQGFSSLFLAIDQNDLLSLVIIMYIHVRAIRKGEKLMAGENSSASATGSTIALAQCADRDFCSLGAAGLGIVEAGAIAVVRRADSLCRRTGGPALPNS
jgi:hypothetical protein